MKWRQAALIIVAVLLAGRALWIAWGYQQELNPLLHMKAARENRVRETQRRLDDALQYLSRDAPAGYVNSLKSKPKSAPFLVARFVLIPVVVYPGSDWPQVVADLDSDAELRQLMERAGLELRARLQPGVAVLERAND